MNLMIQWHQGQEAVPVSYSSWKIRKFKNILICTWHAKLKLIASTHAQETKGKLNQTDFLAAKFPAY